MAAYQSQAAQPSITPAYGLRLPEAVLRLPACDAYISLNAHGGRPEVLTAWMDPAVTDESDPFSIDPTLNMYGEDNHPPYASEFVERYRGAQIARNERITDWCLAQLESIRSRGYVDPGWNRFDQHLPHLAFHVEPAELGLPGRCAPGANCGSHPGDSITR